MAGRENRTVMIVTGHKTEHSVAGCTRRADMKRHAKAAIAKLKGRQKCKTNGKVENRLENEVSIADHLPRK